MKPRTVRCAILLNAFDVVELTMSQHKAVLAIAKSSKTHWRYAIVAMRCLRTLVRRDKPLTSAQMTYFLDSVHDSQPTIVSTFEPYVCSQAETVHAALRVSSHILLIRGRVLIHTNSTHNVLYWKLRGHSSYEHFVQVLKIFIWAGIRIPWNKPWWWITHPMPCCKSSRKTTDIL